MNHQPTPTTPPNPAPTTRTVVVEKLYPHPPEKLWRALTDPALVAQWLLENNFKPVVGETFQFRSPAMPGWNGIIDCKVLLIEPFARLSYSWKALGLDSIVLFTLTPGQGGTLLRVEQSGFPSDHDAAFRGAGYGWSKFTGQLEQLLQGDAL